MITAYDWVKPAHNKNNIQKTQESFQGTRNQQEVCFGAQICEQNKF